MADTTTEREKQYYVCPECGRTVLMLYDDPEPKASITCRDGHFPARMDKLTDETEET